MLYLIFGADEFACSEAVRDLERRTWSDPSLGELNRSVLDGRRLTISELRHHCDAIPFLAERRLVIVEGLATRLDGKRKERADETPSDDEPGAPTEKSAGILDEFLAYLPTLPPSTELVLLDIGLEARDSRGRIAKWAQAHGGNVREHPRKRPDELAGWIRERVKAAGGAIEPRAASDLAQAVGDDTRSLAQEIEKLTLYAEAGKAITADDVARLTPHTREASIWVIVDAVSERRWQNALAETRRLLEEGQHPLSILALIAGQFRLIIAAKSWAAAGTPTNELGRRLGVLDFRAEKAYRQAGRYTAQQLVSSYDRLVATDLAIKTGQLDAPLALELFVTGAEIAGRP